MIRELYKIAENLGEWVKAQTSFPVNALGWVEALEQGQTVVTYRNGFGSNELEYIGLDDKKNTRAYIREAQDGLSGETLDLGCGNVELNASLRAVIQSTKHNAHELAQALTRAILTAPTADLLAGTQAVAARVEYTEAIHSYQRIYTEETGREVVKGQTNLKWAALDFSLVFEMPTNCLTAQTICL